MTEEKKIVFKSKSFVLGKCQCGCFSEMAIRSTHNILQRYIHGHANTFQKGVQNPKWNGGKTITSNGYIMLWKPDHPDRDSRGYIKEHRLIMEKHLGRRLKHSELVHHINGIKTDNRIENLEIMTMALHMQHHKSKDMSNRICFKCGTDQTNPDSGRRNRHWSVNIPTGWLCQKCYQRNLRIQKKYFLLHTSSHPRS